MRKTEKELIDLLQEVAYHIGEHPVEYFGYGSCKPYAKFLYEYFTNNYKDIPPIDINTLLNEIDDIWAFCDVYMKFYDWYENMCNGNDDICSYNFEFMLIAKFLVSNYCDDICYAYFIDKMEEYLNS